MTPVYGSLFSGGGGMDLGFDRAGWRCAWQSDIDKDAVSVLNRHWPFTPQLGSVTDVRGDRVDPVDAIIGGFPCQDLSLAGKRKGLAGEKSGLFYEFLRIVGEMREATHGRYPAVALFENVDGLLSSNGGRDFAHVLAGLQERGAAVAFRVFDAQFFRVPQRRRRVFILADFAPVGVGEERAAQVLALRESLCRHPAPGDEAGQRLAAALEDGAGVGGEPLAVSENQRAELRLTRYVYSLTGGGGKPGQGFAAVLEPVAAFGGNRTSFRGKSRQYIARAGDYIGALGVTKQDAVAVGFNTKESGAASAVELLPTIRAESGDPHMGCRSAVAFPDINGLRWIVRRLTPVEGERCQGWADDWTRYRDDGREISDSARWRMIGNGVATPVAEWLARRMRAALEAS